MHILQRTALTLLKKRVEPGKVVILYGPRRVGKTTLLKQFIESQANEQIKFVNGEHDLIQKQLAEINTEKLRLFLGNATLVIIDEAQMIPEIGKKLKALVDLFPNIKFIASGSAAFTLAQQVGEPLVGRKWTINLFPISVREIIDNFDTLKQMELLELEMLFGLYPEVLQKNTIEDKTEYLIELTSSYLFKDILALDNIKNERKLRDLLTLLAFQIGQEVSTSELAQTLGVSRITIEKYLDLLEQTFIIKNIGGFAKNLRNEVSKTSKYYFYDLGIRNAIINNFNPLSLRNDVGALFENFFIMERIKKADYEKTHANIYFWRTYAQQEIDIIETRAENISAFECKWKNQKIKLPKVFLEAYPNAQFQLIHQDNYMEYL